MNKEPLCYLGGDIMSRGSNLARQEEYDEFISRELPIQVYSPVMNKSINDKSNMTEEENNTLAEKIVQADCDRLWNSDIVVMSPEQNAIGSMCEVGTLYGWKYMAEKLLEIYEQYGNNPDAALSMMIAELLRIEAKDEYFHYFDIRTNHLNEKDWRRSFSINQFLYGQVLYLSKHPEGFESFDEIMDKLEERYGSVACGGECRNDI